MMVARAVTQARLSGPRSLPMPDRGLFILDMLSLVCKDGDMSQPNAYFDGMLLSDAEALELPDWMNDNNTTLRYIASDGQPVVMGAGLPPANVIWQLVQTGPWRVAR